MMKRLALLILALTAGGVFADPTPPLSFLPRIKTVFVIALENHDWTQACPDCSPQQLYGNPAAPYVNSLVTPGNANAAQVSYATAYYSAGPGRASVRTELRLVGSRDGPSACTQTTIRAQFRATCFSTTKHLSGQLTAAGIPWKITRKTWNTPRPQISAARESPGRPQHLQRHHRI